MHTKIMSYLTFIYISSKVMRKVPMIDLYQTHLIYSCKIPTKNIHR